MMINHIRRNIAIVFACLLFMALASLLNEPMVVSAASASTVAAVSVADFSYECDHGGHASDILKMAYENMVHEDARVINASEFYTSSVDLDLIEYSDFSDSPNLHDFPDNNPYPLVITEIGKQRLADNGGIPRLVDNSALKYFPPIGDQGITGTCTLYAMGYYVSTHMTALARDIDVKNLGDSAIFSPGFWYETTIATIPLQVGLVTLDKWPWNERAIILSKPAPPQLWREAFTNRAESTLAIYNPETSESQFLLKRYLMNGYIFSMSTEIERWDYRLINDNPYTSLDDTEIGKFIATFDPSWGNNASHMMTLVGYNDDIWLDANENGIVEDSELGAYKIANSWGTGYANDGFIWLSYNCAAAFWGYFETFVFNEENHSPLLIAEYELTGPLPEYNMAEPIMYFVEYLGWADRGDPYNIQYESFPQLRSAIIGECTYLADFTDFIADNNLDLATSEYDWYIKLEPIYFANDKILPYTIKSLKLTDMDGATLAEYDGELPVSMIGDERLELGITYGQTDKPVPAAVIINDSYAAISGAGSYAPGETVAIDAGSNSGFRFDGWVVNSGEGVEIADPKSATTTFMMPDRQVTITAMWIADGGGDDGGGDDGSGGENGGGDGGDDNGGGDDSGDGGGDDGNGGDSGDGGGGDSGGDDGSGGGDDGSGDVGGDDGNGGKNGGGDGGDDNGDGSGDGDGGDDGGDDSSGDGDTGGNGDTGGARPGGSGGSGVIIGPGAPAQVTGRNVEQLSDADTAKGAPGSGADNAALESTSKQTMELGPVSWTNPFADVNENDWFYEYVKYVHANSLMVGTSQVPMLFSPDAPLTRGMAVTTLYRIAGAPDASGLDNPFIDVAGSAWYYDAVKWASKAGIIKGYGFGLFGPDDNIARQDLVLILSNYADYAEIELPIVCAYNDFIDEKDIAAYAREAIIRFYEAAIINGRLGNYFVPGGEATRSEFAVMATRLLGA